MKIFERTDKVILFSAVIVAALFVAVTLIMPSTVSALFNTIFKSFTSYLGWTYMLAAAGFVFFCLFLAFSKYGKIRLGKDDDKPEYSTTSWFAMLFSAGMGIGLVFWSVAEPITHFATSPFATNETPEAASIAMRTVFFHWGLHPWALYAVVALALAYFQFRKGLPGLISSTLYPLLGENGIKGPIGKTIDSLAVIVTIFGVATSLGLGAMQVTTGLNFQYGIPDTTTVSIMFIAIVTLLFTISAVSGISKGIKFLSNLNMVIAFLLMALVLFMGPTRYILSLFTESIGQYLQNFGWLSFFTDAQGVVAKKVGFDWIGGWTVFYWAWWITWTPFVGSFIARISKGRTIREFMLGILAAPTLLSCIWFSIFGGTALHIQLFEGGGIVEAVNNNLTSSIFVTLHHLPFSDLLSLLAMIVVTVFFITSADSATFVIGMFTSGGNLNPHNSLKIMWGIIVGLLATMLLITGGLSSVQTVSFVVSLPFMIVMIFMAFSLLKSLNENSSDNNYKLKNENTNVYENEKLVVKNH